MAEGCTDFTMRGKILSKLVLAMIVAITLISLRTLLSSSTSTQNSPVEKELSASSIEKPLQQSLTEKPQQPPKPLPYAKNISLWMSGCPAQQSPPAHPNVVQKNLATDAFNCVDLPALSPAVKICVHSASDDKWVSGAILGGKFWEVQNVQLFRTVLTAYPDLHVIDVGANIGQYSMIAAHMGRRVLAVEARLLHAHMVQRAVQLNGYQDRVTLVQNALSDAYGRVTLGTYSGNQGGTHVIAQNGKEAAAKDVKSNLTSSAILMGDLAPVANFSKALLKIDIEGFEDKAFRCGERLFDKVFIPFVMMEWAAMKKKPASVIGPLLGWLQERGYEALQVDKYTLKALDLSDWEHWSFDVIFKHNSLTLPDTFDKPLQ